LDTNTLPYFWSVQYDVQPYESHISYLYQSGCVFCALQAETEDNTTKRHSSRDKINNWVDA